MVKRKWISIAMLLLMAAVFSACGNNARGGGLPDGTYRPVALVSQMPGLPETRIDDWGAMSGFQGMFSITIDGDQFSINQSGMRATVKYSYSDGVLSLHEAGAVGLSLDITYRDGTLYWTIPNGVMELKIV